MKIANNILETIGNTPLVKLNKITSELPCEVLVKIETGNPGNSVKDRMAVKMIEDAEKDGLLKKGGTVIESTSGNTGMGLAITCIVKGYKLICTTNDKQSKEKMDILRAMGAEVIVCPTNVEADDPRSYYSVAKKLNMQIPNSFYANQYHNLSNREAHYESTAPEIWEQTDGKITHFIVGVGTGGTISGVSRYLKEKNPLIQVWGIDTYGSVFKKYHETGVFDKAEIYPYITEGIGEDIIPKNVDFNLIDHFEKVTDKDGALMARKLAREEGIFVGYSAGSAVAGLMQLKDRFKKDDVVVVLFHDHGSRYVGKIFNDDWMRERGFLERDPKNIIALDLIELHKEHSLITINSDEPISKAIDLLKKFDISQIPITKNEQIVGSVNDDHLFTSLMAKPELRNMPVTNIMQPPFPLVENKADITTIAELINKQNSAVLTKDNEGELHIITKHDIIDSIR